MKTFFDESSIQLFAAEFDYFRIPPEKWELMLCRLKQMGINTLAITVPWGFHEFKQGSIDLNGATTPRCSIKTVLKLSSALGFYCLLNVGPYAPNRGILGDGLPLWAYHTPETAEASFQPVAEGWLRAISKTLGVAYQWPHGPVIALQLNCTPPVAPTTLSQQITRVRWPIWLRKQYHTIEAMNTAYHADYQSVNQVEFPANWQTGHTPLQQDARAFITELQQETENRYLNTLIESGWQVPVYSAHQQAKLPLLHYVPANQPEMLAATDFSAGNHLIILQNPIQVHPDPHDIGRYPGWANQAPIRADGSLRQSFWQIRHTLWQHTLPHTTVDGHIFILETANDRLISCRSDTALNLAVPTSPRPTIYRLRVSGLVAVDKTIKISRGKIKGPYLSESETDQTDLLFALNNPQQPVTGYLHRYLAGLLIAQAQTLLRCAGLAERLGQTLAPPRADSSPAQSPRESSAESAYTLNTLEEARRGLRKADAALKKAISSIDSLENGFATILNAAPEIPSQPAKGLGIITPEIFEGTAREILIKIGADCAGLVEPLKSAAGTIQQITRQPGGLTIDQYQQGHAQALSAAQNAHNLLLEILGDLRQMIGAEQCPVVFWRIHDQLQHLAEALFWGVKRGI